MNAGKILLGVLAGAVVGATLGILLAPDKGSKTRKRILEKKDDIAEDLESRLNDLIDGAARKFESIKNEAIRMAKKARHPLESQEAQASSSN